MNNRPHLHIAVRVAVEEGNLERATNVARTLTRISNGGEVSQEKAADALADFLQIATINGEKVGDHISIGPE